MSDSRVAAEIQQRRKHAFGRIKLITLTSLMNIIMLTAMELHNQECPEILD